MKSLNYKFVCVFLVLFMFVSCDDFLVESPKTERSVDQFFQTPEDARSIVNNLYRNGYTNFFGSLIFNGSVVMMGGYISGLFDNEAKGERIEPLLAQNLSFNPDNMSSYLDQWWSSAYNAISTANTAILGIPEVEGMTESEERRLLAEARFFRALNYFFLVKTYGDVPLILEPFSSLEGIFVERVPSNQVYEQIITDLNWSVEQGQLPSTTFTNNGFRVTRSAAATLLAHVHLQRAGYPLQENGSYLEAANAARSVIQEGEHQLIEHGPSPEESAYNVMRTSDIENEYIYSIEFDSELMVSSAPSASIPGDIRPSGILYSRTVNVYRPVNEFIQIYDPDLDLRVQNRQLFYTSFERGGQVYEFGQYAPYLFHEERALFETSRGGMDMRLYRYAEVLLIAAEAIARSEGVTSEAVTYLADVRDRAYWQTDRGEIEAELNGLTEQAFVEEVWKERHRELALDYRVWSDIQRTRLYPVASQGEVEFVNVIGHTNPWGATYEERHLLFPISNDEMQRNPNLVQNPGY